MSRSSSNEVSGAYMMSFPGCSTDSSSCRSEYVRADPTGRTEHPSPPPGCDVLRDFFPMIAQDHHSSVKPAAHGETYEDLHNRAKLFIDNVQTHMAKYQPAGYSVILFTHAATAIALARSLSNDPDFALRTGTASITQFNAHSGKGDSDGTLKWECVQNGAVGHLSGGEKASQAFPCEQHG